MSDIEMRPHLKKEGTSPHDLLMRTMLPVFRTEGEDVRDQVDCIADPKVIRK